LDFADVSCPSPKVSDSSDIGKILRVFLFGPRIAQKYESGKDTKARVREGAGCSGQQEMKLKSALIGSGIFERHSS